MPAHDHPVGLLDLRRAVVRTVVSALFGALVALVLLSLRVPPIIVALAGGDAAGLALFALAWRNISDCSAAHTRALAAAQDPGRSAVYVMILFVSAASLLVATVLVRGAKSAPPAQSHALVALCLLAVALSWTLTHTAFTLRYAHLYYREDHEGVGGIDFAGGQSPNYFDFAYFAFTVGMCFQVSDTAVTSPQIRRAVLLQATMSFAYNTAILAFVLNLAFSFAG